MGGFMCDILHCCFHLFTSPNLFRLNWLKFSRAVNIDQSCDRIPLIQLTLTSRTLDLSLHYLINYL